MIFSKSLILKTLRLHALSVSLNLCRLIFASIPLCARKAFSFSSGHFSSCPISSRCDGKGALPLTLDILEDMLASVSIQAASVFQSIRLIN